MMKRERAKLFPVIIAEAVWFQAEALNRAAWRSPDL